MGGEVYENGDDWNADEANRLWQANGGRGHLHDGEDARGHCDKIDLTNGNEVKGQLPASMIAGLTALLFPVGVSMPYALPDLPSQDWLRCDGSVFEHSQYPLLPQGMHPTYPDEYRTPPKNGRVSIGMGTLGSDVYAQYAIGGEARHALTTDEMPSHNHNGAGGSGSYDSGSSNGRVTNITQMTNNAGGDQAHENRMPYYVENWIIKGR